MLNFTKSGHKFFSEFSPTAFRLDVFDCFNGKPSQSRPSIVLGTVQSSSLAKSASNMNQGSSTKPPNLLIVSDDASHYEVVKSCLMKTGFTDRYCIYQLPKEKLLAGVWMENCRLLILLREAFEGMQEYVEEYLTAAGNVLSFLPTMFQSDGPAGSEIPVDVLLNDRFVGPVLRSFSPRLDKSTNIATDRSGSPLVQFSEMSGGKLVVSGIQLFDESGSNNDGEEILTTILESCFRLKSDASKSTVKWTPIFVHGVNDGKMSQFAEIVTNLAICGKLRNLRIDGRPAEEGDLERIPLTLAPLESSFNKEIFRRHLSSSSLAQVLLYADVLPTTMSILDQVVPHLPSDTSVIVIAAQQSSGLGRSGNAWLSPVGAAMFTLHLSMSMDSDLGRRLSVTQHLVALAVAEAVTERSGYENVGIRIKWPNDLLYCETGAKLGGILVKSSIVGKSVQCAIGCGINLANDKPTICLNDLAKIGREKIMSREEFIARVVSKLESVMRDYSDPRTRNLVFQRYYKRWIHSDQKVDVDKGDGSPRVRVTVSGIDEYGFLVAVADNGDHLTLHPDGNSFDLFRNLIVCKG